MQGLQNRGLLRFEGNKVEAFHSVADRKVYAIISMRQALFDARLHWHITHYNRKRLKALGKEALPDGVAPSEVSSSRVSHLVQSTALLFGFGYYNHIMASFHEEVQDDVLEHLENEIELDFEDILDDDDDDGSTGEEGGVEFEADGESNEDESYVEELSEPMLTKDIPKSVDFADLMRLGGTLGDDVNWTTRFNPLAKEEPVKEKELEEALKTHTSFDECVSHADVLAADHGIDIVKHKFGSVDVDKFKASTDASGRRNAGLRRLRSQGVKPTPVNFNDQMLAKFLEIWTRGSNPSTGVKMRTWCLRAQSEYDTWRIKEGVKAEKEKRAEPPLHETSYELVKDWATKMKEQSNRALCAGAVNAESSELSNQVISFAATSSPLKELDIETTVHCSDLSVTVATAATAATTLFPSPTTDRVEQEMQEMTTRKRKGSDLLQGPPRKKKQKKAPDEELLRRRKSASVTMDKHKIVADPVDKDRRRCPVCDKYTKGFEFQGIQHVTSSTFKFCPLADDHSLYNARTVKVIEDKSKKDKARYEGWGES